MLEHTLPPLPPQCRRRRTHPLFAPALSRSLSLSRRQMFIHRRVAQCCSLPWIPITRGVYNSNPPSPSFLPFLSTRGKCWQSTLQGKGRTPRGVYIRERVHRMASFSSFLRGVIALHSAASTESAIEKKEEKEEKKKKERCCVLFFVSSSFCCCQMWKVLRKGGGAEVQRLSRQPFLLL